MRTIDLVDSPATPGPFPLPSAQVLPSDTHALGEAIASLAGGIHAATYQLLVLLREFDARSGWNIGFLSCAHWLHSTPTRTVRASGTPAWRTSFDLGASREKVRVARALATLPRISWSMERGQLSYAKVRALTRVATAENERALLDVALAGTASQVERFVRAWRRVDRATEAHVDERRFLNRQLATWVDDDGMVVIRGRLTPEVGAVVQRALEAAADRLFREARQCAAGDTLEEDVQPAQRRADALGLVAECALQADLDRGTAGGRYQVVVHVSSDASPAHDSESTSDSEPESPEGGVLELDHGAQYVSAETRRRMSCDAAVVTMRHDDHGDVLDVGRRTRTIPPAIRRALDARDRSCRFPGCTSRRCDAHHAEHSTPARKPRAPGPRLGGWRGYEPAQPGVAVPGSPSFGARGQVPCGGRGSEGLRLLAAGWRAAPCRAAGVRGRRCASGELYSTADMGRHTVRPRLGDRCGLATAPPTVGTCSRHRVGLERVGQRAGEDGHAHAEGQDFTNDGGREVLARRIAPARSIGVHVPTNVPSWAE